MVKALRLSVYSNPAYRKCAAGGVSEKEDEIFVVAPNGPFAVQKGDPRLFRIGTTLDTPCLVPVNPPDDGRTVGPMMGGSYAATSDSRFSELVELATGRPFYGAVAIHDRYETPEQYAALSR